MKIVAGYYNGKRISHGWLNGAIIRFLGEITDVDFDYSATTEVQFDSDSIPTLVVYVNHIVTTESANSLIEADAKPMAVGYTQSDIANEVTSNLNESAISHLISVKSSDSNEDNLFDLIESAKVVKIAVVISNYNAADTLKLGTKAIALIAGIIKDCTLQITTAIQISNTATGTIVYDLNISNILTEAAVADIESNAEPYALRMVATEVHADSAVAESESTAIGNEVTAQGSELEYSGEIQTLSVECFAAAEINRTAFLTFTGLNSNFTLETENHTKNWDGKLEYSTDLSEWTEWDGTTPIQSYNKKLYLSGINNTFITGDSEDSTKRFVLSGDNEITCRGNLLSLLDYNNAVSVEATQNITVAPAAFAYLFYNNTNLISAPYMVKVDLTNSDYCYKCTYYGTGVRSIDTTKVKTNITFGTEYISGFVFDGLSIGCFWSMFEGSKIQNLFDTFVYYTPVSNHDCKPYSFYRMFANCAELVKTMRIVRTKYMAAYCCMSMYEGCTNLVSMHKQTIPCSSGFRADSDHAFDSMFKGCISLQSIDSIDFAQYYAYDGQWGRFAPYVCASMFEGCILISRLPAISRYSGLTKIYGDHCFDSMFKGCINIKLSTTYTSTYKYQYIIPNKTTGTTYATSLTDMFADTGGTFTGTPSFGVTYYTAEPSYGYIEVSIYDGDTLYDYGNTPNPYYVQRPANSFASISIPTLPTYLPQKSGYFFDRWNNASGNKVTSISQDIDLYIGWSDQADIELDMDYTGVTGSYVDQRFQFEQSAGYALIIDWGDGSAQSTTSTTAATYLTHRYTVKDKYTIKARCNTAASAPPTWRPLFNSNYSCVGAYYYYEGSSRNRPNTTLTEVRFNNGNNITYADASLNYAWGHQAFITSNALKKITFGSGFKSSGYSTFNLCPALEEVVLSEGMEVIGEYTFAGDSSLKSVTMASTVTKINRNAFYNCQSLDTFSLPSSLVTIGINAFTNCYKLPPITIPDTVTSIGSGAFMNCRLITDVNIPDGVTTLANNVFNGCTSLHNLHIGTGLTTLYGQTFRNCPLDGTVMVDANIQSGNPTYISFNNVIYGKSNNTVVLGGKNTSIIDGLANTIGEYAFYGRIDTDYTIPSRIGTIGEYAFAYCNIPNLTLNCVNTTFASNAFYSTTVNRVNILSLVQWCRFTFSGTLLSVLHLYINDAEITEITIPSSITDVGSYQFSNAVGITSLTLPNNVTNVSTYAFSGCTSLNYVYTPDVCTYGSNAFNNSSNIKTVSIGNADVSSVFASSKTSIETIIVRDGVTTLTGTFSGLTALKSVTLSNTLTTIPYNAFNGCMSLTTIVLPASLTNIGESAFNGCTSLSNVTFNGNSLKTIDSGAFYGCSSLVNISIPDGVETLSNAFSNCALLESVTLPNTLKTMSCTFNNCPNMQYNVYQGLNYLGNSSNPYLVVISGQDNTVTTVTLHNNTKIIDSSAFYNYASLTSASLNNSLITVGSSAFQNCTSLTSIVIPNSVTTIGGSAFRACTELTTCTLSASLETIGDNAFNGCTKLDDVILPDSLTEVGESIFYNCTSLSDVTIGSGLNTIGVSMFNSCTGLTTIIIPDNVTTIGGGAFANSGLTSISLSKYITSLQGKIYQTPFSGCVNLTSITIDSENTVYKSVSNCIIQIDNSTLIIGCKTSVIPTDGSVEHIGVGAFYNIPITSVTIPNSVTSFGVSAFHNTSLSTVSIPNTVTSIGASAFGYCQLLTQAILPNGITTLANDVFESCILLDNIIIPNTVTTIGNGTFSGCTSLQNITLSTALTTINSSAFSGCSALAAIDMPSTMTTIASNAYYNCTSLMSITCRATTPPTLDSTSLNNVPATCIIYVPSASVSRYKSATNWSARSTYIQAIT